MIRDYTPFAFLSIVFFMPLFVTVVPAAELLGVFVYLGVAVIAGALLYRNGIKPIDPAFSPALFVFALVAKLIGSLGRYWTLVGLYGGASDAVAYHEEAVRLAPLVRAFDFSWLSWYSVRGQGSTQMVYIATALYSVLPASLAGSCLFFAMLALGGSVLFYRAVRLARRPDEESATGVYALLIFFGPSILFWPSSLGKDAWIFLGSGLVALGWVQLVRRNRWWGLLIVALGLAMIGWIRLHIAAFLILAMGGAYLIYGVRDTRRFGLWLIGLIVMGALAPVIVTRGLAGRRHRPAYL